MSHQRDLFDFGDTTERDRTITERFWSFHGEHPEVYDELVRLARRARSAGHQRTSMKMLFEVVRWNRALAPFATDGTFKLNNNFTSRYARLIMARERDLDGLFETRALHDPDQEIAA